MSMRASNIDSPRLAANGAASSTSDPTRSLKDGSFHRILRERFKWSRRGSNVQFCAVVRHAERADGVFSFTNGLRWCDSDDCKRFPFDAPLSDYGKEQAVGIGNMVKGFADSAGTEIHVVVTSPYARCIQTAVAILQANPGARLVMDRSLGEVYGPCIMGPTEPDNPLRPFKDSFPPVTRYEEPVEGGRFKDVKTVGKLPVWPEDISSARLRFASRFLTYMNRGRKTKRNFVIVTHGDGVAASLAMMPSHANDRVCGVEYGGLFIAQRRLDGLSMCKEFEDDLTEGAPVMEGSDGVDATSDDDSFFVRRSDSISSLATIDSEASGAPPTLPISTDGWEVKTVNINLRQRVSKRSTKSMVKNWKQWCVASSLPHSRVKELLGQLLDADFACVSDLEDINSDCSVSTYLFGQSDDESLPGSDDSPTTSQRGLTGFALDDCGSSQRMIGQVKDSHGTSTVANRANIAKTLACRMPRLTLGGQLYTRRTSLSMEQKGVSVSGGGGDANSCGDSMLNVNAFPHDAVIAS